MITEFSSKVGNHIFTYHLVGFERNIVYSKVNRSIMITDAPTGAVLKILSDNEDLEFEDFVLVAKNLFLDIIDLSN